MLYFSAIAVGALGLAYLRRRRRRKQAETA
jgi:MYXO-CTERM domain-containing protein